MRGQGDDGGDEDVDIPEEDDPSWDPARKQMYKNLRIMQAWLDEMEEEEEEEV